jgi:3-methylcrotonyl-CoA carboxylase alpha subunit
MKWVVRGLSGAHEVEVERSSEGFWVTIDGRSHAVDLICLDGAVASLRFVEDGRSFQVAYQQGADHRWRVGVREREFDFSVVSPVEAIDQVGEAAGRGSSLIEAPIPGKVVSVAVEPGDEVSPGQSLVVLEAMKMENELTAEQGGRVAAVHVTAGDAVDTGAVLVELE